jgi:hypothetical protein
MNFNTPTSMIKKLIPVLAILCSLSADAQDAFDNKATVESKGISVGVNFSPDFCFRTLRNNDGSSSYNLVMYLRNKNEVPMFGYSAGLNLQFNCTRHFALETGIQYAHKGYQTKRITLTYEQPDPNAPQHVKTTYHYYYVDIPLKANFIFGKSRLRFLTSGGLSTNILIKENQSMILEYADSRKKSSTGVPVYDKRKLNISSLVSIGIDYKLNPKISIVVQPTFRYGIIKTPDTPVSSNLWSAGLNTGLSCRLN